MGSVTFAGDTSIGGAGNTTNDASTVSITSGTLLELNFVGTDTVSKLFLIGVQQVAGAYPYGNGSLVVTSSPVGSDSTPPVITVTPGQS